MFCLFCEHRHVILPSDLAAMLPLNYLMTETEWRNLGVQQSPGWIHYMIHSPGKIFHNVENCTYLRILPSTGEDR